MERVNVETFTVEEVSKMNKGELIDAILLVSQQSGDILGRFFKVCEEKESLEKKLITRKGDIELAHRLVVDVADSWLE